MKTIGIMGAMPEEVVLVVDALAHVKEKSYAGATYYTGERNGKQVVVCCAGIGKANAAAAAQVLITYFGADVIFFSGIAGNMSTEIGIGDVVVSETLCYHDAEDRMLAQSMPGTALYTADSFLIDVACKACEAVGVRHIVGKIATGDQFIGDPELKKDIARRCAPHCVEMEGAAVAQIAMRNHIPFVVVRAMSDNSDEAIESLGAEHFDIAVYVKTSSSIAIAAIDIAT